MTGGGDELKLLGMWASPFVLRVQLALGFKGLSYEYVEDDLFNNKSELLLSSNPVHKKVPVLIHNGKPVCESQIIVQYIDEVYGATGPSLLPADPYERAVARFWAAYIDDKLIPSCIGILKGKTEEERAEKLNETFVALELLEAAFGECSKGKAFFGGDTVGYLDIALGCFLCWLDGVGNLAGVVLLAAARMPKLAAWAERFRATEPIKALVPGVDKVEAYVNTVLYPRWNAAAAANHE